MGRGWWSRRRWATKPDGDLWQLWCDSLVGRGPASVVLEWVPGHTGIEQQQTGLISASNSRGNAHADA
eukprot:860016-Alexandrium_andersonii.AAC.1